MEIIKHPEFKKKKKESLFGSWLQRVQSMADGCQTETSCKKDWAENDYSPRDGQKQNRKTVSEKRNQEPD